MKKILILLAGFLGAFVTISLFELGNYFMFPFPEGFNMSDTLALAEFSKTLPAIVFVNVLIGWIAGAVVSTVIILKLARKYAEANAQNLAYISAGVLTLMGILNNFVMMPGVHPTWFHFGLPLFFIATYLSLKYIKNN